METETSEMVLTLLYGKLIKELNRLNGVPCGMGGKPTGSTDGLPFSVAPVKPGTGSGTRVAPVLCVTPHASVSSQEQVYP